MKSFNELTKDRSKMVEKVIVTITVQDVNYNILVCVPVIRRNIREDELYRRARNIFNQFAISDCKLQKERS